MTIAQLLTWSSTIPTLINAGIMEVGQIANLLKTFHSTLTDAQLAQITALIIAGAKSQLTTATADAAGAKA